ncbi:MULTISPECIES: MerR family transcriptional regulator [Sphingomonas]|uniref:MerR family transcriptional regulator n=1 Tax=Sphingomonas TaxID=13687 RepID=UPI000DEEEAA4|nr:MULTISPECIES: MerR family transcriptional regulator [Sphingomonas]
MTTPLDIRDVARQTGLTSRALRFYEARGLVAPLRTHSGRRLYGPAELEQLNRVLALKKAGLTLAQIERLTRGQSLPLAALIDAQLAVINDRTAELAEARALLVSVKSRIDRGEPVDAATFCSLIRHEELTMTKEQWDKVSDQYLTPEAKADFAASQMPEGFDQAAYSAKWADLGARAKAMIPLGPDSPEAGAIYDEWQDLLAPFKAMATPAMAAGVTAMYEKMGEWQDRPEAPSPGFDADTFRFIQEVGRRRQG